MSYSSSSSDSDESIEIPEDLNSTQFLLFAGFSEDTANVIWQSWNSHGIERFWVVDDAKHYVREKGRMRDAVGASDDWHGSLREMGMSDDFCRRVLDPAFDSVRLTECACFWALDTIDEAFAYLSSLDHRIQQKRRMQEISRMGSPDESVLPRPGIRSQGLQPGGAAPIPTLALVATPPPEQVEGRTMFYKGGSQIRLESCVADDGTINMFARRSSAPTDFHLTNGHYVYLTKQREIAHTYARFVEARVPSSKAAILQIAIPRDLVDDPLEIFGDDWRELIWHSRKGGRRLPANLQQYVEASILVGPVCSDGMHLVSRMSDKAELSMMKLSNGSKGSQWAIQSVARLEQIDDACSGFLWVTPVVDHTTGQGQGRRVSARNTWM
ncbi:hypothetical protein HRG_010777 [Hirsutella rhossiliensis]|uniref:Uncharacterized protein n=1 Tax=Hirsutella rhossiliensis TaxID=111463 RepID=A0A9P8MML4_9HYPO|nr:uncharacterized protein HRG_10777 [Hirsutella rhossiliensis]KAH0958082.1 hypothetical protein HRG_10777 [Hirsutella rhossiliensis]